MYCLAVAYNIAKNEQFSINNKQSKVTAINWILREQLKMSKFLRKLGLKKPVVIDYWDCSKLNLYDLPKEVFRHRQTLKSLYISNNNIRDIPKVMSQCQIMHTTLYSTAQYIQLVV